MTLLHPIAPNASPDKDTHQRSHRGKLSKIQQRVPQI